MTRRSSRVSDPTFNFDDAPDEIERYPIPGLLIAVQPSRWVNIREDLKTESELGNPLAGAITDLMGEVGGQQHRYVLDMRERDEPAVPVETEEPEGNSVGKGLLALSESDLHRSLCLVMTQIEAFADMKAIEFNDLVTDVVNGLFD